MKNINRTKSEPILCHTETSDTLFDQTPDHISRFNGVSNGSESHTFYVNGESSSLLPPDTSDDDSQYVALDCEFVGVGPKLLSALGMYHPALHVSKKLS